jgi:amphi-Trp domain-containing protein
MGADRQKRRPLKQTVMCHYFLSSRNTLFLNERKESMSSKAERDVEKKYPMPEFISKLRRLADSLEKGEQFEIQIAGERIFVPVRATYNIEHEREKGQEEIEFQIKWSNE